MLRIVRNQEEVKADGRHKVKEFTKVLVISLRRVLLLLFYLSMEA